MTLEDLVALRYMIDEQTKDTYGDVFLQDVIDGQSGNLTKAAAVVWGMKAAAFSKLTNVTESGSTRNIGERYAQALKMANFYGGEKAADAGGSSEGVTRVRQIQRPTAPNP